MRVTQQVLFTLVIGILQSVQAEGESVDLWRKVIARAPQGRSPPVPPGKGRPGRIVSTVSIPTTSVLATTVTNEVTVILSRTDTSLPTILPSQTAPLVTNTYPSKFVTFSQITSRTSVEIVSTLSPSSPSITPVFPSMSQSTASSMATSSPSSSSASPRILVIVLSTILGSIAIILAVLVVFLICRFRKRKQFKRGVTPINDEEIESWRNKERKQPLTSSARGIIETVSGGRISPDWTWTSSGNVQSPPRAHTRGSSLLAKAPNARVGLTTEVVPGDAPFIPIVKRQSSRLSKSQPSHIRTKSMRSSTSARSIRSMNGVGVIDFLSEEGVPRWHNSEDRRFGNHSFSGIGTSSPATSVYVGQNEAGGLSPRPQSRQWERSEKSPQPNSVQGWPISWN